MFPPCGRTKCLLRGQCREGCLPLGHHSIHSPPPPPPPAETPKHDSKEFQFASDSLEGADGVLTQWRGEKLPPLCDHLALGGLLLLDRSIRLAAIKALLFLYGVNVAYSGCEWPLHLVLQVYPKSNTSISPLQHDKQSGC